MGPHKFWTFLGNYAKFYSKISALWLIKVDLRHHKIVYNQSQSKLRTILSKITLYLCIPTISTFYIQLWHTIGNFRNSTSEIDPLKAVMSVFVTLGLSSVITVMVLMVHFPKVLCNVLNPLDDLKDMCKGENDLKKRIYFACLKYGINK